MRRVGHRGAMGHAPENTPESFEKAIALGCDEVETDVWLVGERFVVSHDRPGSPNGLSLDEVLAHCRGRVVVNVELKTDPDPIAARRAGAALARSLCARGDVEAYLSSFSLAALEGAREAAPDLRLAYIVSRTPEHGTLLATARSLGLAQLHVGSRALTQDLVRAAQDAGIAVYVWTVNEPDEIARFAGWGVDGIVSDYPERVPRAATRASRRIRRDAHLWSPPSRRTRGRSTR